MSVVDSDSLLVEAVMGAEPQTDTAPPSADHEESDREHRPVEFDQKWREPFTGLLYVGALTVTEVVFGHEFVLSTPTQTERMEIGQVIAPYVDTVSGQIAYTTAFVAACLVSVDGHKLPEPVMRGKDTALHDRFKWVHENLRKPVVDELYSRCLELEMKVQQVLDAMGKA